MAGPLKNQLQHLIRKNSPYVGEMMKIPTVYL